MNVKDHYKNHLSDFYSWMIGDFSAHKNTFLELCKAQNVTPLYSKVAIDLGAGTGIQSFALAELGFKVIAVDFDNKLLAEMKSKLSSEQIEIIEDDIRNLSQFKSNNPEIISCCGDTISHLNNIRELRQLFKDAFCCLSDLGKFVISFRDYSKELLENERFIPVKNDEGRILTCIIEYFEEKIRVTDLMYEKHGDIWQQKVSSYFKIRITKNIVLNLLEATGFKILYDDISGEMHFITAQKRS